MGKTSSRWFYCSLLVLVLWNSAQASTNHSLCRSWSDQDFAEDANQSAELLNTIVDPKKLGEDIVYTDQSAAKPKVDRLFEFDRPENIRCMKLAVRNQKISVSESAHRFAEAVAKFRGCSAEDLKGLLDFQRKQFADKLKTKPMPSDDPEKRLQTAPEQVHRMNWSVSVFEKTDGRILPFMTGASVGEENFGSALFKLKNRDGKTIVKRVPVNTVTQSKFCGAIPALERRLNALFDQEQARLLAKQSDDGTAECLAWFSSSKEFNGTPAGTGLLSYLKIEPVTPAKFNFDENYTQLVETDLPGTKNKSLTLRPYQSEDRISIERDGQGRLVSAELITPGVRKSRFGDEKFFNKVIQFDYSSGRCRPQTIQYVESGGTFKVSNESCKQVQKAFAEGQSPEIWKKLEPEMKAFMKLMATKANNARNPASSPEKVVEESRNAFKQFCDTFDYYLD